MMLLACPEKGFFVPIESEPTGAQSGCIGRTEERALPAEEEARCALTSSREITEIPGRPPV
jgi:hypothetical protein